ncbi:DUF1707 domain-containing protein [Nocardia sp. NPDC057440]|uniref:DUF1707 SHOCT-like domain-containing protein n=1 Tax=Nocardia sp. NPDC057440 TaxID=3346134 RepID=UPI00367180B9
MATTRYGGIRARDTDRADVCGLLDAALAEGQLTEDEHTARTAKAMRATTFGELDDIAGDLQIPGNLVDAPVVRVDRRRPRRWFVSLAGVIAAAVFGAAVGGVTRCAADGPGSLGSSEHVPVLTTGAGLAYFIAEYRAEFGDTKVDKVTLYPGYVLFDRQAADTPTVTARYHYDGSFRKPTTATGRKPDVRTLDLAAMDVRALAGLLAGAAQTTKTPGGTVTHASAEFDSSAPADAEPVLQIYTKNEANASGFVTVTFTGEPLRVSTSSH